MKLYIDLSAREEDGWPTEPLCQMILEIDAAMPIGKLLKSLTKLAGGELVMTSRRRPLRAEELGK